jgi:hypothetical protein
LIVGSAVKRSRRNKSPSSWGVAADPGAAARKLGIDRAVLLAAEAALEEEVSRYIRAMPFLWLPIDDPPGTDSLRGYIERNAIALLSNYCGPALDPPSATWLGRYSDRERVRRSGLWNSNHVDGHYAPEFLEALRQLVDATRQGA